MTQQSSSPRSSRQSGFSLAEVVVAAGILSFSLLGVMAILDQNGMLISQADRMSEMTQAARNLLEEIDSRAFWDPQRNDDDFGLEAGEDADDKTTFDDVDDFCGWVEAPPQTPSGQPMIGFDDISLAVRVWYGNDDDQDGNSDTNATDADDDGTIEFVFDVPTGDVCLNPGAETRFKVIEVTASQPNGLRQVPPVVMRSVRFR
ncbi:MAG: prepilin-type N-terminal cleavage/methylation domain-containing protein [Acidobacteriota bacterium]